MLQLIKHMIYMIQQVFIPLTRSTSYNGGNMRLKGYIFIIENTFTNTVYIGSAISKSKIEEIYKYYYRSDKYICKIIHRTASPNHTQRRKRLKELQEFYYTKYSCEYGVVLQI